MARTIRTCKLLAVGLALAAAPAGARDTLATYLQARAASAQGDDATALADYAAALAARPNAVVALRAYREAVRAGAIPLALSAIAVLDTERAAPADAAIVVLADAVVRGKAREIDAALDRVGAGPFDFLVPVVRAWQAQDGGKGDPITILSTAQNPLTRRYAADARALLLIATKHNDAGLAAARAQLAAGDNADLRWNAAQLLAGRGSRSEARELLGGVDPGRGVRPSLAFGTGRLLLRVAGDLADQRGGAFTVLLARSAVLVEPGNDRARIVLAEALLADRAEESVAAVLMPLSPNSPFAAVADALRVQAQAAAGQGAAALTIARTAAERDGASAATIARYGDYLTVAERFADAAAQYQRAADVGGPASATDELRIGNALDRAGRWNEAKPHLARALAAAPNAPEILNAVGYARLEHGEDVSRSRGLLERALAAAPDNVAIVDSVGFAYLLSGDAARAVPLLERAARAEDSDPVIVEHLGDAYWSLGRRFEARHAWREAAAGAGAADAARLAARIERGPPAR